MGLFGAVGAMRAVERLKSGRSQSEMMSIADIAMITVNMSDAQRNLPRNEYLAVQTLFNELQRKKEKKKYTLDEYMDQWTVLTFLFDSVAPFELYCGNTEIAVAMKKMKQDPSYCEMRDAVLENPAIVSFAREYEGSSEEASVADKSVEPVNVLNDHYSPDQGQEYTDANYDTEEEQEALAISEEAIQTKDTTEQSFEDNDLLEKLYFLSVEESNNEVYDLILGNITGALQLAIYKMLADYFSNNGTNWICSYMTRCGLSDDQIQGFLENYESMYVKEEYGSSDVEWDLQETDDIDLTLMYRAVATLCYSAPSEEAAERLQQYLSQEKLEYLLTDCDSDDPVEAAIYNLFMFYDLQFIDYSDTTDDDSPEDTEPLDDEVESVEIDKQSIVNTTSQQRLEEAASQKSSDHDNTPVETLIALKQLLDEGVLTQEEYDAKKALILNQDGPDIKQVEEKEQSTPLDSISREKEVVEFAVKQSSEDELRSKRISLVGKNSEYYIPIFEKLDQKGGTSWNWCGFFFGPYWFAYRKMYGWVAFALIVPTLVGMAFAIGLFIAGVGDAATDAVAKFLGYAFNIVFALFSNGIYKKRIDKLVNEMPEDATAKTKFIQTKGGVSVVAVIITIVIYAAEFYVLFC